MKNPTYYNGIITPYESAAIPLSDRSVFFGDAIYEVMIGRGGKVYQFEEHFSRLTENSRSIGLNLSVTADTLSEIISELISLSHLDEFTVYVQISGNAEKRAHLRQCDGVNLLVSVSETSIPKTPNRIKAITCPDMRYGYCNLKTTNLLPAVLSMNEANEKNADIAIFHLDGLITECSHANLFVYKDGVMKTPPLSNRILPGITRRTLLNFCSRKSIPYLEENLWLGDLFRADAVTITSTTKLLQICTDIDGKSLSLADDFVHTLFTDIYDDFLLKTR